MTSSYLIGAWRFDPANALLLDGEHTRKLEDRAARTLAVLCDRRGQIVSKDELIASVWQGRSVSPNSVAIVIGDLRRALDDDPRDPKQIITIARRGYKLADAEPEAVAQASAVHSRRRAWWIGTACALVMLIIAVSVRIGARPLDITVEPPRNETGSAALDGLTRALDPVVLDGVVRLKGVRAKLAGLGGEPRGDAIFRSRLILWNGSPELAMSLTDARTNAATWSGFAAGPPAMLARHVIDRIATLQARLRR